MAVFLAIGAFVGSVVLANWLIANVGEVRAPNLHVLPVGFRLEAPSGVIAVGLGLTARDIIHELGGSRLAFFAILLGGLASLAVSPVLALASACAFVVSELSDLLFYSRLRDRSLVAAVLASNTVGSMTDSAVFLLLAFGPEALSTYLIALIVGKLEWSLVAIPLLLAVRSWLAKANRASQLSGGSRTPGLG